MMSVEQQAQALADWLADNPGAEPPAGVDSDVIEAVYSLRPDLAPAPRVSIDDILGMVSSGPLAAPVVAPVPGESGPAKEAVVSTVPESVSTPVPANNNRRLWAVLGGFAALAAAVLVTVQVSMNSGQGSFAPTASAPELAIAPPPARAPGAARQANQRDGGEVALNREPVGSGVVELDAVADLGEPTEAEQEEAFQTADAWGRDGDFVDDVAHEPQFAEGAETEELDSLYRNEVGDLGAGLAFDQGADPTVTGALIAGDTGGADGVEMDANAAAVRPRPVAMPAPEPAPAVVEATTTRTSVADAPPPPPADARPSPVAAAPMQDPMTDDFLDAAVAEVDEEEGGWVDTPEAPSMMEDMELESLDQSVAVESSGRRRDRGQSRGERRGQRARGPQASAAPEEQQAPRELAEQQPDAEPAFGLVGGEISADAGVAQAQQRARDLADRQQYSAAFDVLRGYISPAAPLAVVLDATEYAFAAGRWADTVRVASIRLDANVPSDSAQDRSRLYDFRARAQAMLDERTINRTMMNDDL